MASRRSSDDVQLLYQHSTAFDAKLEDGVRHDDPSLAIDWPLPVRLLSPRDRQLRLLHAAVTEAGSASSLGATIEASA